MRVGLILAVWIAAAGAAMAQPRPGDSVTVTGARDPLTARRFVETFTAPTRITGKIARWEVGVCPITVGLKPVYAKYISQRVRDVAAEVGAPVNKDAACKPNIEIVFTTTPQALLDNIRKKQEAFLGYADTKAQRDKLAQFHDPIKALYLTQTVDLRGKAQIDSGKTSGQLEIQMYCDICAPPYFTMRIPGASAGAVTGARAMGDGLRAGFHHVIIAADPTKLRDHEVGTLGDYVAMLALTQLSSLDVCQNLASVTSLLTPGCATSAQALTVNDLGYLRGLYHMNPERALSVQQDQIAWQIGQETVGEPGKGH